MRIVIRWFAGVLVVLVGLVVLGRLWAARAAPAPASVGVVNDQLSACPDTPNCVSSQATDAEHKIEAISYSGDAAAAQARMRQVLEKMPRTRIVVDEPRYLHAENRSLIFGYVDDVEIYLDAGNSRIQIRSASRLGISDLGANRGRVEAIRTAFAAP